MAFQLGEVLMVARKNRFRFFQRCELYWFCQLLVGFGVLNLITLKDTSRFASAEEASQKNSGIEISADAVQKLVLDLAEDSRQVRYNAETRLLKMGPEILQLLPEPDDDTDANVRQAIERIRRQLELKKTSAIFEASTFTLLGRFPLKRVLDELSRQTGNLIEQSRLSETQQRKQIDCEFQNVTFWTCITELAKDHQWSWTLKDQKLVLVPDSSKNEQRQLEFVSGVAHVALAKGSVVDVPSSEFDKHWKSILTISVEPRLQPLAIRYVTDDIEVRIRKSKLSPFVSGAEYDRVLSVGTRQAVVPTHFLIPSKVVGNSAVKLTGSIDLVCASPNKDFEVSTRSDTSLFVTGSLTLNVTPKNSGTTTRYRISAQYRDSPIQFESHFSSVLPGDESLLQTTKSVPPLQASITGDGNRHQVTAAFKTIDVAQAEKLVIHRPVALRTVTVPFEFKDVKIEVKRTATLPARESR